MGFAPLAGLFSNQQAVLKLGTTKTKKVSAIQFFLETKRVAAARKFAECEIAQRNGFVSGGSFATAPVPAIKQDEKGISYECREVNRGIFGRQAPV
jgi:hypothetical protein